MNLHLFFSSKIIKYVFPRINRIVSAVLLMLSVATTFLFIYELGFPVHQINRSFVDESWLVLIDSFMLFTTIQLIINYLSKIKIEKLSIKIAYILLYVKLIPWWFNSGATESLAEQLITLINSQYYTYLVLAIISLANISIYFARLLKTNIDPPRIISIGFALIITIGAGLLLLPNSTTGGISVTNAFFVSSSALCVVGLTPVVVSEAFTTFGQVIILSLIQLGGIGIMTLTCFFVFFFSGNVSVHTQMTLKDAVSSNLSISLIGILKSIFWTTLTIELIGAVWIWASIHNSLSGTIGDKIWFSIFHSVSAFCNAGFSTLPGNLTDHTISSNSPFIMMISALIVFGGLGFPVIINLIFATKERIKLLLKKEKKRYTRQPFNLNTKIIIVFSISLIVGGAVIIGMLEWNNALKDFSTGGKIVQSIFCSISPRTAGFNTVAMTSFTLHTTLITIILMWIGGGAQSTAGGIKINTLAVLYAAMISGIKRKNRIELYGRKISSTSVIHAISVVLLSFGVIAGAMIALTATDADIPILHLFYEVVSAVSTVGLSIDTTPLLSNSGKVVIILLMFVGRIGVITLLWGLFKESKTTKYNYPEENIIIN